MERTVDGDNVTLRNHFLERLDTASANGLFGLSAQWLVVVVEELLAVEGLETTEDTLTDAANSDGTDNLVLEIILLLGTSGHIPVTTLNLLVSGDEVADEDEDSHDDMLGNGDDIAASDLGDGDTAVGGVGSVQVDVVRANTSSDSEFQVLGLG